MRALTATGVVRPDRTLVVQLPADVATGAQTLVIVLEEGRQRAEGRRPLKFSPHPVGPADPASTYRREEIYGDDGR
jgi:hypothetical protein